MTSDIGRNEVFGQVYKGKAYKVVRGELINGSYKGVIRVSGFIKRMR